MNAATRDALASIGLLETIDSVRRALCLIRDQSSDRQSQIVARQGVKLLDGEVEPRPYNPHNPKYLRPAAERDRMLAEMGPFKPWTWVTGEPTGTFEQTGADEWRQDPNRPKPGEEF